MASEQDKKMRGVDWDELKELAKAPADKGDSWFLGIGINQYDEFPTLNNAVKDVEDVQKVLTEMYDIKPEKVITLFDEKATKENIIDALDQLVEKVDEDDKLLIYYSGHGHLNERTGLGYWIPNDAARDKTSRYILNSTVRDYVKVISARHILLISDSCFSGSLFVRGASRSTSAFDELDSLPSRWAICSGRHDEQVYDGEPGGNSPFADSIINTLRNNHRNLFNVAKLADRVVEQTRANYEQLPEGNPLYGVGHKGGQYIFRLKANEAEDWARCRGADTLAAYQLYLEKYPEGKHLAEAKERLGFHQEEEAWQKAQQKNTVAAYYQYDRNFPNGRYTLQALEKIRELEEEKAWQEAKRRDTVYALRKYTLDYPKGKYRAEADQRLQQLTSGAPAAATPPPPKPPANKPKQAEVRKEVQIEKKKSTPQPRTAAAGGGGKKRKWWLMAIPAVLLLVLVVWLTNRPSQTYGPDDWEVRSEMVDGEELFGYQLDGKWMLKPTYELAMPFRKGKAKVKQDGQMFMIDEMGACIGNCPEKAVPAEEETGPYGGKDREAWEETKKENTLEAYENFVKEFPSSPYVLEARGRIDKLKQGQSAAETERERVHWSKVTKEGSIGAFQKYISEYPNGRYVGEARKYIKRLQEEGKENDAGEMTKEALWEKALKERNLDFFEEYLSRNGKYKERNSMAALEYMFKLSNGSRDFVRGWEFLLKNKEERGVVTLPSGLQYKIIRKGKGRTFPGPKDEVTVHYRGKFIDGKEFDSSHSRNQSITMGVAQVMNGWQEALQKMTPGSKWEIYVPPHLGYGAQGAAGGKIPPYSTLIFEIELLDIN